MMKWKKGVVGDYTKATVGEVLLLWAGGMIVRDEGVQYYFEVQNNAGYPLDRQGGFISLENAQLAAKAKAGIILTDALQALRDDE